VRDVQAEFPQTSASASAVQIDVENDEIIEHAVEHVQDTYGRLDALVNNAGEHHAFPPIPS
jgi:NADP-dependent 3-hydroxy acid dehydrogenase YdfG